MRAEIVGSRSTAARVTPGAICDVMLSKLAAFLDEAETDVLAYISFPAAHRAKLHSTNPLECINGEIKPIRNHGVIMF